MATLLIGYDVEACAIGEGLACLGAHGMGEAIDRTSTAKALRDHPAQPRGPRRAGDAVRLRAHARPQRRGARAVRRPPAVRHPAAHLQPHAAQGRQLAGRHVPRLAAGGDRPGGAPDVGGAVAAARRRVHRPAHAARLPPRPHRPARDARSPVRAAGSVSCRRGHAMPKGATRHPSPCSRSGTASRATRTCSRSRSNTGWTARGSRSTASTAAPSSPACSRRRSTRSSPETSCTAPVSTTGRSCATAKPTPAGCAPSCARRSGRRGDAVLSRLLPTRERGRGPGVNERTRSVPAAGG